jgi:hypothetical protein
MDFSKFQASSAGVKMSVIDPTTGAAMVDEKTGSPVTITLIGKDHPDFRSKQYAQSSKRVNKLVGRRRNIDLKQMEQDAIELLAHATKGWEGIDGPDGHPLAFSHANAVDLYTRYSWLREQVDEFIDDRSHFLGN